MGTWIFNYHQKRLLGQGLAEYGVILMIIVVATVAILTTIGGTVSHDFSCVVTGFGGPHC